MKTTAIIILLVGTIQSQNVYELTPGTKGNQIVLQLSNISFTESAENVDVKLIKQSANLKFNMSEVNVKNLNKREEKEALFSFDVSYAADISKQDTVEFVITDQKTIHITKQFIFSYTAPKEYKLEQNYPNPFNPSTTIKYTIPQTVILSEAKNLLVTLKVYDVLGNKVATLVNEYKQAGNYEAEFSAYSIQNLASGIYFYRLQAGNPESSSGQGFAETKKMMLLR